MSKYTVLKYYMDTLRNIEDLMDIRETSNYQLDIFKSIIPGFVGCYPSNKIPRMKNNESCIINTDDDKKSGEHWTALIKYQNKFYFYDSFGRSYKTLSKCWINKKWNDAHDDGQSTSESSCGQHCIAFIYTFQKFHLKCLNIL